jgi:hypothetical protein
MYRNHGTMQMNASGLGLSGAKARMLARKDYVTKIDSGQLGQKAANGMPDATKTRTIRAC